MNYTLLEKKMYTEPVQGGSMTGNLVEVIGEQKIQLEDGRVIEQYIYNIMGYTPENGKPFVALKANIITF
jgi:hypothetical protein